MLRARLRTIYPASPARPRDGPPSRTGGPAGSEARRSLEPPCRDVQRGSETEQQHQDGRLVVRRHPCSCARVCLSPSPPGPAIPRGRTPHPRPCSLAFTADILGYPSDRLSASFSQATSAATPGGCLACTPSPPPGWTATPSSSCSTRRGRTSSLAGVDPQPEVPHVPLGAVRDRDDLLGQQVHLERLGAGVRGRELGVAWQPAPEGRGGRHGGVAADRAHALAQHDPLADDHSRDARAASLVRAYWSQNFPSPCGAPRQARSPPDPLVAGSARECGYLRLL